MLSKKFIYLVFLLNFNNCLLFCKGESKGNNNIFTGDRLSDFGNFGILKYEINNKLSQNQYVKDSELEKFYKIDDEVKTVDHLNKCFQNMVLIKGKKDFNFGSSCDGGFADKKVDIETFFLSSTKITRDQYYKFLETVNSYLRNKNKPNLFMSEERVRNKFFSKKRRNKKKKIKNKKNTKASAKNNNEINDQELADIRFEKYLEDYFKLRNDIMANLDSEYLRFLLPRFEEYKKYPLRDDDFMNEYIFNDNYGDYPIILVNYYQYVEYCKWQTLCVNEYLFKNGKGEKVLIIFYPVSYEEYFYASCCGDSDNIYSCGMSAVNNYNEKLFNFNDLAFSDNKIRITKVRDFPRSSFNVYDFNGNTRVWFGSSESMYSKIKNYVHNFSVSNDVCFSNLLKEGIPKKDTTTVEVDNCERMTSRGSCNSRLSDTQNGRFKNENVLFVSPFLGFTIAAKLIFF